MADDDTVGSQAQGAFLDTMSDPNLDPAEMLERGTSQAQVGELGAETSVTMQNADNQNTVSAAQAGAEASGIKDNEKDKEELQDGATDVAHSGEEAEASNIDDTSDLEGDGVQAVGGVTSMI